MSDEKQEPRAKLDYTRVGGQWNRAFAQTVLKASQLSLITQKPIPADPERAEAVIDQQIAAMDGMMALAEQQAALIAQVVVSIPREWAIPDAPADVDWNDPQQLTDYMQVDRYQELLMMVQNRTRVAAEDAKN